MKFFLFLLAGSIIVVTLFAEEVSSMAPEKIDKLVSTEAVTIPQLVKYSSTAGVGRFVGDCSNTNVAFVDIAVDQWWTTEPGTNMVRFYKIYGREEQWTFPTNVPVVFFGMTKEEWYGEVAERALALSGENAKEITFNDQERSWFRVSRDNGLLYSFATNLWDCVRTNSDEDRYYNVLRNADREITNETSWRVRLDAYEALTYLFDTSTESFLTQKLKDPQLRPIMRNSIGNTLMDKFEWQVKVIDGVPQWAPPD